MSKTARNRFGHVLTPWAAMALCGLAAVAGLRAQDAAAAPKAQFNKVLGSVVSVSPDGKSMTVKADSGATSEVLLDPATTYMRVPPGEKDLKKATRIELTDVGPGDRIYARSRIAEGQAASPATTVFVMSKAEIAKRQEATAQEWQTRGAAGKVATIDPAAKTITISSSRPGVGKELVVQLDDKTNYRRYAPDSVKFSDAVPSKLTDIGIGDSLRVLGEKDPDGGKIHAEEIVSGSFRSLAGTVMSVDASTSEIKVNDLQTKKPVVIKVNGDTNLRKLPPQAAAMLARFASGAAGGPGAPGGQHVQGGPDSKPGFNGPGAPPAAPDGSVSSARPAGDGQHAWPQGGVSGPGGPPSGPGGFGGRPDINRLLQQVPQFQLADLKPGDALLINSTNGSDPSRVTAITVVAGVEPMLAAAPQGGRGQNGQSAVGGMWNLGGDIGLPQ